jgi:hypothetical protein
VSHNDGYAIIPALEVERAGSGDKEGIEDMLSKICQDISEAMLTSKDKSERHAILVQSVRELEERTARGESELQKESAEVLDEVLDNPDAAVRDLSMTLLPKERELLVLRKARDLGRYFRVPGALEAKLVAALDLVRLQAVEAALHAALSYADTQTRAEQAGLFESEKHIFIVGERTQNLRAAAKQLHRESQLLERELNETRARQLIAQQTRLATGAITSEQVSTAISTNQG